MLMLWAIPLGILAGLLAGGQLENLSGLRVRWAALALAGLAVQVLFTPAGESLADGLVPAAG